MILKYGNRIRIFYPIINVTGVYKFIDILGEILIKVGQKIKQGQIIGETGGLNTPESDSSQGPHLHETILVEEIVTKKVFVVERNKNI